MRPCLTRGKDLPEGDPQWRRNPMHDAFDAEGERHMTRKNAAAAAVNRVSIVGIVLACCCFANSAAWAIDCLGVAGDPKTGWYSWREIDGRKCWFKKTGAMPAKSELQWPAKARQEARLTEPVQPPSRRTEPAPVVPPEAEAATAPEPDASAPLRFKTARVKPATGSSLRPGVSLDLMDGTSLSAKPPANLAPADPFHARFIGNAKPSSD